MDPGIEGTSAAKGLEIEGTLTSAAEDPEIKVPQGTSLAGTIFRAPAHIRFGRESDLEPKLVSIGPYHHGRKNLQPMEVTKTRFMSDLLNMSVDENQSYLISDPSLLSKKDRVPVESFIEFGSRARSFYKEKFDHSNVDFVRMLVLDSCFIIRIMLSLSQYIERVPHSMAFLDVNVKEVRSDLLLLENQIPLFFIKEVYNWLFRNANIVPPNFVVLLKSFIRLDLPWNKTINDRLLGSSDHLLDFYWRTSGPYQALGIKFGQFGPVISRWILGAKKKRPLAENIYSREKFIENATELYQMAGIEFGKLNSIGLEVEFVNGILRMPCLRIDSSHRTLFVNLITYEDSKPPSFRIISTYIKLMDDLIDSEKDVELLQKYGVIYNTLSSHTNAATHFNDMGNFCLIGRNNNCFSQVFKKVDKYYKCSWNRRWADLQQNYFSSPWASISVYAAVFLLFLSGVQTYYTVFPKK